MVIEKLVSLCCQLGLVAIRSSISISICSTTILFCRLCVSVQSSFLFSAHSVLMDSDTWSQTLQPNEFQVIWNRITFTAFAGTKKERVIVRDVSGRMQSGQMMAFLGPSGSGKSTILECLVRKRRVGVSGNVYIRTPGPTTTESSAEPLPAQPSRTGSASSLSSNESNTSAKSIVAVPTVSGRLSESPPVALLLASNANAIHMSFIAQKDDLFDLLTVRESIMFATRLQVAKKRHDRASIPSVLDTRSGKWLPSGHTDYCSILCDQIIGQLGLQDVANNRLSACSGGQRKRVSIGQELPSRPRVLLLDEPTSGLDSNASFALIRMLNQLTRSKPSVAIMLSIHQPGIKVWQTFDMAYVLARGGRPVYQGSPDHLTTLLSQFDLHCPQYTNVADYIIEVANDAQNTLLPTLAHHTQTQFDQQFDVLDRSQLTIFDPNNRSGDSVAVVQTFPEWKHMWILTYRNMLVTLRDPLVFGLRFGSHLLVGIFFAAFYGPTVGSRGGCSPEIGEFEPSKLDYMSDEIELELRYTFDNIGGILFATVFLAFSAIMPVVIAFPLEVRVFARERANRWYSLRSYFLSKTLSELPFQLVLPTMFSGPFYALSSQPRQLWRAANFVGFNVMTTLSAQSIGYVMGACFMENITTALFFGPLTIFPAITLSGVMLRLKTSPWWVQFISWASYIRWTMAGMTTALYGFARCGEGTNDLLKANREAFKVWLAAMLGVYNEPESVANGTDIGPEEAKPSEQFVNELVNTITDPFISNNNRTQSLAMNEMDLEDEDLYIAWFALIVYFFVARFIVYHVLKYKTNRSEV